MPDLNPSRYRHAFWAITRLFDGRKCLPATKTRSRCGAANGAFIQPENRRPLRNAARAKPYVAGLDGGGTGVVFDRNCNILGKAALLWIVIELLGADAIAGPALQRKFVQGH